MSEEDIKRFTLLLCVAAGYGDDPLRVDYARLEPIVRQIVDAALTPVDNELFTVLAMIRQERVNLAQSVVRMEAVLSRITPPKGT